MKIKKITKAEVEYLSYRLAREMLAFNEPIPDFSTRYPNVLERCLLAPFQTFGKKFLYKGLAAKASILFYTMIKNHPFQNGNKRIALTTLIVFLYFNKKWLSIGVDKLYELTMSIAQSPSGSKDKVMKNIENIIKTNLRVL